MNKKSILNLLKATASFVFMIGILYYSFGRNPEIIQRDLLKVNYIYVFLSMIFGAIAYVNRGLRWIVLIDALGYKASKLNSIASVSVGYLTNLFIPRAGEVSRCSSLKKFENIPVDKLFGTILIERVIDLFFLLLGGIIAFLLNYKEIISSIKLFQEISSDEILSDNESSFSYFLIIPLVIILGFIYYIYLSKNKKSKLNFYKNKVSGFISGLKLGFKSIQKIKNNTYFWFHTLSIWIMYFLMTYVCFYTIPETYNLGFSEALFLFVLGGIGMVIPSPGGVGSYHGIIMIGLVALQIDKGFLTIEYLEYNPAYLFPFIVHTGQTFVAIIMGSLGLLALFINNKKLDE